MRAIYQQKKNLSWIWISWRILRTRKLHFSQHKSHGLSIRQKFKRKSSLIVISSETLWECRTIWILDGWYPTASVKRAMPPFLRDVYTNAQPITNRMYPNGQFGRGDSDKTRFQDRWSRQLGGYEPRLSLARFLGFVNSLNWWFHITAGAKSFRGCFISIHPRLRHSWNITNKER